MKLLPSSGIFPLTALFPLGPIVLEDFKRCNEAESFFIKIFRFHLGYESMDGARQDLQKNSLVFPFISATTLLILALSLSPIYTYLYMIYMYIPPADIYKHVYL